MNRETPATPTSPAEAERQAARTRAELADTLDALDEKLTNLTTRHLVEKGFNMIRDSLNNSDGLNRSLDIVRANPVPIALIGLGTAWLIASNTGVVDRIANDERIEAARRRVTDMASDLGNRAGSMASDMAGKIGMGGGDRPLGQTGNPMIDENGRGGSSGWVHQASDMAQGAMRSVRESTMINRAGEGAGRIADQVSDAFERNPLVVGAVGLLAGALIAALLPATRFEDELVGTTRDQLWEQAQEAGQDAITRARDTATHAIDSATDAAATRVRATATQVIEAATEAATDTIKGELGGASKS
jgi:Protein of unknown function (DUF3618)